MNAKHHKAAEVAVVTTNAMLQKLFIKTRDTRQAEGIDQYLLQAILALDKATAWLKSNPPTDIA